MTQQSRHGRNRLADLRFVRPAALAVLVVLCATALVHAQGLVYYDAVDWSYGYPPAGPANIYKSDGSEMHSPSDGVNPFESVDGDDLWGWRSFGAPDPLGAYPTIYESIREDCPEVLVKLRGLPASTNYDVYVVYWSDRVGNWNIRAGITRNPGANQLFDRLGDVSNGAIAGTYASSAAWATPPANNPDPSTDEHPSPFIEHTPGSDERFSRDMYLGSIGTKMSTASGQINVWLDDLPDLAVGTERTWIDGLAFVEAGTPVFLTATVDRATGNLTVSNPTPGDFTIVNVSLTSAAGALNGTVWNTIADAEMPGMVDTDNDWLITSGVSASETELAEQDGGFYAEPQTGAQNGVVLQDTTGVMDFGNIWRRTPYEDVQVALTTASGTVVTIAPEFTGTEILAGDFNADGVIDVDDYLALVSGLQGEFTTVALAYAVGDIDGDSDVDRDDVLTFRSAYEQANGAGSFATMVASLATVPEPASLGLLILGGALASVGRKRGTTGE